MKHDEAVLQQDVLKWFSLQYPDLDGLLVGYTGGINLDIKTRCRMKRMGLRAGFPDLQLMVAPSFVTEEDISYGLLIELKTPKGIITACQKDYHAKLRQQNYTVVVCRSFEEARDQISYWLKRVPNLARRCPAQ